MMNDCNDHRTLTFNSIQLLSLFTDTEKKKITQTIQQFSAVFMVYCIDLWLKYMFWCFSLNYVFNINCFSIFVNQN